MISEAPQNSFYFNSCLSNIPSRFIKPTIFLASKGNTKKPIFHEIKKPDQAKYFKKYFGHKVLYVKRSTQIVSIIHSGKLLQKISFDKSICQKDGFKSSFDAIVLANDITASERSSKKILKGFRGKLSLAFKAEIKNIAQYLKTHLNNLQGLEIMFQKAEQLSFDKRAIDGFKSLQSFSLKFDPKFEKESGCYFRGALLDFNQNSDQQNPLYSLFLLLQKTHLKRLKLNLAPYPLSFSALSYLLLSIEQVDIPEWYVKSGIKSQDFLDFTCGKDILSHQDFPLYFTNSSAAIQNIDFFGLYGVNFDLRNRDDEYYSDECSSKEFSPQLLSKMPQLTSKSRKVLDITLTERLWDQVLLLTSVLEKFRSLEGLYIKAPENVLGFDKGSQNNYQFSNQRWFNGQALLQNVAEPEKTPPRDFPWMKNLKHAILSIVDSESYYKSKPLEDLVKHFRDSYTTLESLNVFYASTSYDDRLCGGTREEDKIKVPCKSLAGFSSLKELEINSGERGLEGVTKTLESLKSLRKLRLNFCDSAKPFTLGEKATQWDSQGENIFDGLEQLKEFELVVRPDQSEIEMRRKRFRSPRDLEKGIPTPLYWARHLTKNLHKLKNLEALRVFDSKETQIEMEVFLGLLKALSQFTSLREIVIHSKITLRAEALDMAADLYEDASGTVEDRLIGLMKSRVNRIIDLNPNLTLVDIRSLENTKVDLIFYKTK